MQRVFTYLAHLCLLFLIAFSASAQVARHNHKNSNPYRSNYQRATAGSYATFEIRGGTLWAWGQNGHGQLGDGTTTNRNTPVQIGSDDKWVLVAGGTYHTLALKSDGTLWAWGRNDHGQLGDGTNANKSTPVQIGTDNNWVMVSAGQLHTIGLKSDGTIWSWGSNGFGQLGHGNNASKNIPVQIGTDSNWISTTAGDMHTVALKSDGTLWSWGQNLSGQLGDGSITDYKNAPVQIGADNNWASIAAGEAHTVALKSNGTLWAWGKNDKGQLGDGTGANKSAPVQIGTSNNWASVAAGAFHSMALKSNGTLWAWGWDGYGQLGTGTGSTVPLQIGTENNWVSMSAGYGHTLAVKSNGSLWAWGLNGSGQLGNGDNGSKSTPQFIRNSNRDWLQVSLGSGYSIALKGDGTLWAWGGNSSGQLGIGTNITKHTPVQMGSDTDWTSIVAGLAHTLALKSDGTLWAWGWNGSGQLGDGTSVGKNTPVQVGADNNWVSIAAGNQHSLALKSDGTLWAWGSNGSGWLGDGTTIPKLAPVQIGTDNDWTSIAAAERHTVALKSNGTLWAWGENSMGQLGDGTGVTKTTPVQIGTDNKWVSMAVASYHTIALKSDGTLWAWGNNGSGQLGDGTINYKFIPMQIGTDNDWVSMAAGFFHSRALKSNGTLWAWGENSMGQLGDGTKINKNTPTLISYPDPVVGLSKNSFASHSGIFSATRANICLTGQNNTAQLGEGSSSTEPRTTFGCTNNICQDYTPATFYYCQDNLAGTGYRTDFQWTCRLIAAITPAGADPATGSVRADVFNQPSVPFYKGHAYVQRHYDIQPSANPNTATADITLYFTQSDFDHYNAANGTDPDLPTGPADAAGIANLRVSQFHGTPTGGYEPQHYPETWGGTGPARVLLTPTSVIWNEQDSRWEVTISVTGFSGFFVHGNLDNIPLPLRTQSFTARMLHPKEVLLQWQTAKQELDERYTVERSADGSRFIEIGSRTPGAASDYRLHDYEPLSGRSFYRLKVTGKDGSIAYSEVRSIFISGHAYVQIYPTPAKDFLVIETNEPATALISDLQGRPHLQFAINGDTQVDIRTLAAGVYILRLSNGQTFKVVKE